MNIRQVGIAGAGTMGAGIGQILARHGYQVVVVDREDQFLYTGKQLIQTSIETLLSQDLITPQEIESIKENLRFSTSKEDFRDCQLVIEAIIENIDIKKSFWKEVEAIVSPETILASNTSGLSINAMSEDLVHKNRFIGMHFWNPAQIIPLVELIKGHETTPEVVEACEELCRQIGKVSVVVLKDAPGFIGNRLQFAVLREALHIIESGIATAEDVDKAMMFGPGFRYPHLGPIQTADMGGLDVFYSISSYLNAELADRHDVSPLLKDQVDQGHFGTKTGQGFYDYPDDRVREVLSERDENLFQQLKLSSKKTLDK